MRAATAYMRSIAFDERGRTRSAFQDQSSFDSVLLPFTSIREYKMRARHFLTLKLLAFYSIAHNIF